MATTLGKLCEGMVIQTLGSATRIQQAVDLVSIFCKVRHLEYIIQLSYSVRLQIRRSLGSQETL